MREIKIASCTGIKSPASARDTGGATLMFRFVFYQVLD